MTALANPVTFRLAALELESVGRAFDVAGTKFDALRDVSLTVCEGEFIAFVGASGCGKSTLLKAIVGLDRGFEGSIRIDGKPVDGPNLDRSIVFQEHRLLPWLTVEANVGAALRRSGLPSSERKQRVAEQLDLVGLSSFAKAYPAQLSGGMAQRVAIARALVTRPRFLLLDEPLGALDALTRLRLQGELARLIRHEGTTALLVTHDVDEAVTLADRIVVMKPHPGRVARILDVPRHAIRDRSSPAFLRARDEVLGLLGVPGFVEEPDAPRDRPAELQTA
ncbi:ABC transporter related protein [Rhodomicrobium vannielii ATCC 17100]|uniref:ABC transporter related protein n=1 Tax=Rhodomicrobium vannielii (strain ATCC 17100 / DSM 162 / LMG 4299 / NCIMB 10020 / ATH 3.1.1) TaxID=648757 RepID=E3I4Q9_RHOVT|nr:ABC transporter ATP-binding protein [Rhodomicrobium vannielii]ADP72731.1 ABC transporter related protein [Rhodomicrobium vannielii ATCC 17100]